VIVVSNTSPLTNLAAIGQFDLLHLLYRRVHIARGVWEELNASGTRWPGCVEVSQAGWVEQHTVQNRDLVTALRRDLDRGEAETVALALQLGADLALLDEKEGRHAAQRLGVRVVGVVGVLLEAKTREAIQLVRPHLDALRQEAGFYIDASLYQRVLDLANESDSRPSL
jgi:predicted nucleic acid-binding protein